MALTKRQQYRIEKLKIKNAAKVEKVEIRNADDAILASLGISNQQYKSAAMASMTGAISGAFASVGGAMTGSPVLGMNKQSYGVGEIYSQSNAMGSSGGNILLYGLGAVVLIMLIGKK